MKEWSEPNLSDLSVADTESAIRGTILHDGTFYDTQYGDFEGYIS